MTLAQSLKKFDLKREWTICREWVLSAAGLVIFQFLFVANVIWNPLGALLSVPEIPADEFVNAVESGEVSAVVYDSATYTARGTMTDGSAFLSSYGDPTSFKQLAASQPDMTYSVKKSAFADLDWDTIYSGFFVVFIVLDVLASIVLWLGLIAWRADEHAFFASMQSKTETKTA